ncbi:hypothetical protein ACI8AV_06105 [Geodermatophilus sp. SYSU D00804]
MLAYRPEGLTDAEWADVADLVHLGMATLAPRTREQVRRIGWALGVHARVHLRSGTSRTVPGWYGSPAVATSLAGGRIGRGKSAYTVPARFGSSYAGRLRTIGRALVPASPPPPKRFTAYPRQEPLTAAELEEVFDFCATHGMPALGRRLALLVWLICGTGAKRADLVGATGTAVQVTEHAVVFTTAGPTPRRIPVLGACEAPILDAALAAGDAPLLDLSADTDIGDLVIATGWRVADRFPLTAGRLRATWLAAVLAGGAPFAGVLAAAGLTGEKTFADLLARLPALDDAAYETALRCSDGPLPVAGQLTLPGLRHPALRVPLLDAPRTSTGRKSA